VISVQFLVYIKRSKEVKTKVQVNRSLRLHILYCLCIYFVVDIIVF